MGKGSHNAFLFVLALPGGTHPLGKLGARGALETQPGRLARPRAGGRKPRRRAGSLQRPGGRGSAAARSRRGSRCPPQGGAVGARVCGEHWRGGSESLVGSPGLRWGWGQCWRIQIPFSLSFVCHLVGSQVHSPAWERLMSCGWSPVCPPLLGHQVDWTDRPGSCFSPLRRRGQVEALSREA